MPRIIDTDNSGGDYPDESFHLFPMSSEAAQRIVEILNEENREDSQRLYCVVSDDYELRGGFKP